MQRPLAAASVLVFAALLVGAAEVSGQAVSTRSTYPAANAADRDWLRSGDPIHFAGDSYFPGGAPVHFDPELMLHTGSYDGVPLFVDTSVEPYSQVLVPIGRNLLQPYERLREGALAGTTGSRTPSYPVEVRPDTAFLPQGAFPRQAAPRDAPSPRQPQAEPPAVEAPRAEAGGEVFTARSPQGNRGIWIRYEGRRWELAGEAVELDASFKRVGDYKGFPVFERPGGGGGERLIYVRSRDEVVAPYKVAE
jgi:hypothetical protein